MEIESQYQDSYDYNGHKYIKDLSFDKMKSEIDNLIDNHSVMDV